MQMKIQDLILVKKESVQNYYQISKTIHKGKTGSIYEAVQISNKLPRAIKEIELQLPKNKKINGLKFEGRCGIISSLDHPNIMRLYEIFYFRRKFVLVLEYLEVTLEKWAKKAEKSNNSYLIEAEKKFEETVKTILIQLLKALSYLH